MAKELPGTDEETVKLLGNAKKGKTLKFALIYKGANVLKLVVFKKGGYQAQINAAKKEGHKGKACWGMVSGKGPILTFTISREDGFDKAPVKEIVLKKFLLEEAQLKLKATFEIVSELQEISDADDEGQEVATASATEPDTDQEEQEDQETEIAPEPDSTEYKERLVAMMPGLKKALSAGSPLTGDLKKYADAAQKLAKAKQFDKGIEVLDKLEGLIEKALVAPAVSADVVQEVEAAPPDQDQDDQADQDDEEASPDEQEKEQEVKAEPSVQEQEEQEPAPVAAPPPPASKAADPSQIDEQENQAQRDARQKDIAEAYRDLPDPLKFTTLDAAAGKCAKITSENRNTVDALDAYQDLITECVQWTRSDDAKEHKDAVGTVETMRDNATAERDAIKEAIAAAAALKAKLASDFKERLVELMPLIMEAQGPESPVATDVAKLFKDVQQQGKARDFEAGHESLDAIEVKIKEAKDAQEAAAALAAQEATPAAATEAQQEEAEQQVVDEVDEQDDEQGAEQEDSADDEQEEATPAAPVADRTLIFRACSNDWQKGRKKLHNALEDVEKVLLSEYTGDELFGEARDNTKEIYSIMDSLDDRLCFALDDAALDGEANIKRAVKKARKLSNEYLSFISSDPLFNALEQDKELPLGMKAELTSILNSISVQIT